MASAGRDNMDFTASANFIRGCIFLRNPLPYDICLGENFSYCIVTMILPRHSSIASSLAMSDSSISLQQICCCMGGHIAPFHPVAINTALLSFCVESNWREIPSRGRHFYFFSSLSPVSSPPSACKFQKAVSAINLYLSLGQWEAISNGIQSLRCRHKVAIASAFHYSGLSTARNGVLNIYQV